MEETEATEEDDKGNGKGEGDGDGDEEREGVSDSLGTADGAAVGATDFATVAALPAAPAPPTENPNAIKAKPIRRKFFMVPYSVGNAGGMSISPSSRITTDAFPLGESREAN